MVKDKPSPSDIFRTPRWIWTGGAYGQLRLAFPDGTFGWRTRVKKEHLLIPFTQDPYLYAYPIPGTRSMDAVFDKEHHLIYIDGYDQFDHDIMVEWLANEWLYPERGEKPRGNIIYYNIPGKFRRVHRLLRIDVKGGKRLWTFRGDNNFLWFFPAPDPYPALDEHIKWLVCSIIY